MAVPPKRFWEDLLLFVEEGKVIPVIGPELVTLEEGGSTVQLYHWLARRLAEEIELPLSDLPDPFNLNDVVAQSIHRGDERDALYPKILRILRTAPTTPSPALRSLANLAKLKLFVSLTFDNQLETAVTQARHGAIPNTIFYATNALHDLSESYGDLQGQTIFHLLGLASSTPDYAICDDDLLEFLHALQDAQRRPAKLFDALRANHLLFLGCGFDDWLARFFLRTARGMELSQRRKHWDVMADARVAQEKSLVIFLSCFSAESRVLEMSAGAFVEELTKRWHDAHSEDAVEASKAALAAEVPKEGAIFVSYAHEDLSAAQKLAEGLQAAGLDVWWDKKNLKLSPNWELAIHRGIKQCALFLPLISRTSLGEGKKRDYMWREWNLARKMADGMAPDEPFIFLVAVDDTPFDQSPLPEIFPTRQGTTLIGGEVTPEFAKGLTEIVRNYHRRLRDASR